MEKIKELFDFSDFICYNSIMIKSNLTFNWPLVGNGHIIDFLAKAVANNKIAGAYIFSGPDNLGKTTTANYFARSLVCQRAQEGAPAVLPCGKCPACGQAEKGLHGDIHLIKKDKDLRRDGASKKNISIEQIRDFIRMLGMASFLNSYKIGIIKHAESLSIEAANALLKTLEEPKIKVVIILVTSNIGALPATIVSRSQVLRFKLVKADLIYDYLVRDYKAKRSIAKDLSCLCLGRPSLAVKFLEDKEFYGDYLNRANAFLRLGQEDINKRLDGVEELIGAKAGGQESVKIAGRIIEIWQGITRDLLLLEFDQPGLLQHLLLKSELEKIKTKFKPGDLLNLAKNLRQAKEYLAANVNPKLVLENIAINI